MSTRTNSAKWIESRGRWQINVQKDGVRKTFTSSKPGRTGQREANAKADAWLDDGILVPADLRVSEAWEKYLDYRRELSAVEYKKIECFGRLYFLPALGHRRLNKLSEQDLQTVLDHAFRHPIDTNKTKQLSRKSLHNFMCYETQFCKFCRKSGWSTLLPEDLKVPAAARYCGKKILQIQDLVKLMNVDTTLLRGKRVHDDYINYYRFQVLTGLRPGELRGLRWSDIQGDICQIHRSINSDDIETLGKNENALRSFKLIPLAMKVLEDQRQESGHFKEIFPMTSLGHYYERWKKYQKANAITPPISLYEMRHTFVSATKSLPEGQLKQLVGHSQSMDTYGTYSHILENDADNTADAVQEIFTTLLSAK